MEAVPTVIDQVRALVTQRAALIAQRVQIDGDVSWIDEQLEEARQLLGVTLAPLKTLPANSVHMVVTSPPYWSLRDYGVPPTMWGGNPAVLHARVGVGRLEGRLHAKKKWQHSMTNEPDSNGRGEPRGAKKRSRLRVTTRTAGRRSSRAVLRGCGAWRGCLGLEPTPELYVEHIVLCSTRCGACCARTARAG
jgi:hypothetical protein